MYARLNFCFFVCELIASLCARRINTKDPELFILSAAARSIKPLCCSLHKTRTSPPLQAYNCDQFER